ncbi:hypothetical protein [Desulfobacula sp.]|uniref:hypothetical protein n=1 Tax=Desulfobacula sp. TaxID=2593537 RepID=UPI00260AA314|nr:hypothetical protein [Desulfobacula sp.]
MKKYNWKIRVNFLPLPKSEKETRYKLWVDSFNYIKKTKSKQQNTKRPIKDEYPLVQNNTLLTKEQNHGQQKKKAKSKINNG